MAVQFMDVIQGTPEWIYARLGMPTTSEFATVMASGVKKGEPSKTRATYMKKLAGEVITGQPAENYKNEYMARGNEMEAEARKQYRSEYPLANVRQIGFVINGPKGCSPDSFVSHDGLLEIKTQAPHLLISTLHSAHNDPEWIPPEHKAQTQGALWVCEKEWIDLLVYWPLMPTFLRRQYRDEAYIKQIADAVDKFNQELTEEVEFIRSYGTRRVAA